MRWRLGSTMTSIFVASCLLAPVAMVEGAGPLRPRSPFDPLSAPLAPDYSHRDSWAALPERTDAADIAPRDSADHQESAVADVFFVHSTTYLAGPAWNADTGNEEVNARTAATSMRHQASVFNSAGRVYAPRYRQGVLYAYTHHDASSLAARELAYTDVARAFDHYLTHRRGHRPFILAGHSQGAHHLLRLLEERLAGTDLARQLVAAYLIGVPLPSDKLARTLAGIPLCDSAQQTGCIVTWNTVAPGADRRRFREVWHHYPDGWKANGDKQLACTNPLSWRAAGGTVDARIPLAAVATSREGPLRRVPGPPAARCSAGLLEITPPQGRAFRLTAGRKGDYHVYDLPLFHLNVRRNAAQRVRAFFATNE